MSLDRFLSDKRSAIIKKWRDLLVGTYPIDTQRFLKKEKDRFSNPVGQTIAEGLEVIYDELIAGNDTDKITASLDRIIRIRAVQDFKPSEAVGFVIRLKRIIRDELGITAQENEIQGELEALEQRIEKAALLAFDIYANCRQKLYELKVNETKNQVARFLKRANLTIEVPENEPDL